MTGSLVAVITAPLNAEIAIAEDGDVAAGHPSLRSQCGADDLVFACGNMRGCREMTCRSALRLDASHHDLEMPALIAGHRADVGAIDEYGYGTCASAAHAMWTCQIPLFDLLRHFRQTIADRAMIVRSSGRHKQIKNAARLAE